VAAQRLDSTRGTEKTRCERDDSAFIAVPGVITPTQPKVLEAKIRGVPGGFSVGFTYGYGTIKQNNIKKRFSGHGQCQAPSDPPCRWGEVKNMDYYFDW
jgi:hypothetical protein